MSYKYLLKYIIIGDTGCGKSCIFKRFIDDQFYHEHDLTIGVEFGVKTILSKNGQTVKIQLWDTSGQEMFRSITRSYYRGAIVAVVVFDITRYDTFKDIRKWFEDVYTMGNNKTIVILVGNKTDLSHKRQVTEQDAQKLVNKYNCFYIESSAKIGHNVNNIFTITMEKVLEDIEKCIIVPEEMNGIKHGTIIKEFEFQDTYTYSDAIYNRKCCNIL